MTDDEFRSIFQAHKTAVYQFAWRLTNSVATAEDIAQEVFLNVWRGDAVLNASRGSWRSLLLGMVRNAAWNRWRRDRKWSPLDEHAAVMAPLRVESMDLQQAISQAMQVLTPLQREALLLATYSELSLDEIAEATGAEVGTVKARLHRARENLKRLLAAYKPGSADARRECGTARRS